MLLYHQVKRNRKPIFYQKKHLWFLIIFFVLRCDLVHILGLYLSAATAAVVPVLPAGIPALPLRPVLVHPHPLLHTHRPSQVGTPHGYWLSCKVLIDCRWVELSSLSCVPASHQLGILLPSLSIPAHLPLLLPWIRYVYMCNYLSNYLYKVIAISCIYLSCSLKFLPATPTY